MSVERFGNFKLDHAAGELRLRGREVVLQPRVFQLLAYLVSNRDRVIDKEELLSVIWPGLVVTDASLQRAVSLARSALRKGGLEQAIRNYSRRGYRFCVDAVCEDTADPNAPETLLKEPREAFARSRWSDAVLKFTQADGQRPLAATDLEQWGIALQCEGRLREAVAPLERAASAYSSDRDVAAAARVSIVLARIHLELREIAVAKGCLHRAASLLEDLPTGVQHGHFFWMSARFCIYEGDMPSAIEHARRTLEIGKQLGDSDLEAIGKLYWGAALQSTGETRRGIELQDEAAAAVVSGSVSPLIGGIVYCGLLAGCCNAGDLQRATQWTDSFTRWCERSNLRLFHGSCLLHRAEVFAARGELSRAHSEIMNGDELLRITTPWAVGDAQRLLGDVHLARGEFEQAETAYRAAREHGWDPYPGYAMLLHYRGQSSAAIRGLQRATEAKHWVAGERRANYLAHIAIIAALSGAIECAVETLGLLDEQPAAWSVGVVHAYVIGARGELALARRDFSGAIRLFRQALDVLKQLNAPVDTANWQVRLAASLTKAGEREEAEIQLLAARKTFEQVGARFYVEQCAALHAALPGDPRSPQKRDKR